MPTNSRLNLHFIEERVLNQLLQKEKKKENKNKFFFGKYGKNPLQVQKKCINKKLNRDSVFVIGKCLP